MNSFAHSVLARMFIKTERADIDFGDQVPGIVSHKVYPNLMGIGTYVNGSAKGLSLRRTIYYTYYDLLGQRRQTRSLSDDNLRGVCTFTRGQP